MNILFAKVSVEFNRQYFSFNGEHVNVYSQRDKKHVGIELEDWNEEGEVEGEDGSRRCPFSFLFGLRL